MRMFAIFCLMLVAAFLGVADAAPGAAPGRTGGDGTMMNGMMTGGMMDSGMMMSGPMLLACIIFGLLILVVLVLALFALIKYLRNGRS
jgi:hypothetical protein